ncbi:hypothetical protein [Actinopolymorpha rutila]|uniref:Uncharacterized protein n=1 Tax=Actinopolymorpha rutila TaxID=446787 RepID=A0A852ZHN4_9ACTN|nr:hypothetical protein [Actinopolymorpha rutila]NYH92434.1 hypothetical protein [Actinopolymorpha rutila]
MSVLTWCLKLSVERRDIDIGTLLGCWTVSPIAAEQTGIDPALVEGFPVGMQGLHLMHG